MKKVGIGILGGGWVFDLHGPALRKIARRCKVVAVAVPDKKRDAHIRATLGDGVRIYRDYREVLEQDDVDAVDNILPHDLHLPSTVAAAKAGKHVLVEKVMARNVYECDKMIAACEAAGVSLTVCHDRRYDGEWMALKDVVDSGILGQVFYWKLEHNQDVIGAPGHWLNNRDRLGGGAIMSCLTHQIDSLRFYDGEVESVTCMTKSLGDGMEGEPIGVIVAKMKSGALAHLSINWRTRSNEAQDGLWYELVHVCGTKGEAYYMADRGTYVMAHGALSKRFWRKYGGKKGKTGFTKVKSGKWNGHERCIAEWVKSVRGEKARIVTSGRDARKTVEVAEAAYLSEEKGRTITLPIKPKRWKSRP